MLETIFFVLCNLGIFFLIYQAYKEDDRISRKNTKK